MFSSLKDGYHLAVLGATGGIDSALCRALERDPKCSRVIKLSRSTSPAVDLLDEATLRAAAEHVSEQNIELDGLLIASGILQTPNGTPPEKSLRDVSLAESRSLFETNAIGPALALKHFTPLLSRTSRTLTMALSARVGSIGDNQLGGWISYRASKAALNQVVHTTAIELARRNRNSVCVSLHPGTIETPLSEPFARDRFTHSADECAINLINVLDRLSPDQTGGFFDYAGKEIPW